MPKCPSHIADSAAALIFLSWAPVILFTFTYFPQLCLFFHFGKKRTVGGFSVGLMERRVVNPVTEVITKVVCVFLFLTDRTHQRGEVNLEEARHMVHWLRLIQDLDNPWVLGRACDTNSELDIICKRIFYLHPNEILNVQNKFPNATRRIGRPTVFPLPGFSAFTFPYVLHNNFCSILVNVPILMKDQ